LIFSSPSLFGPAANLAFIKGKAIAVPLESNARGVALMGLATEGKTYQEMASGGAKVLYAVGEVPVGRRPNTDFLVVQNSHLTALAKEADVVLPSATFLESAGTMIDYLGRLKYLPEAIEPQGEAMSHREIFIQLAKALGSTLKKPTEADIKKAAKAKAKPAVLPFEKNTGYDVSPAEIVLIEFFHLEGRP
jgi:anaerobic selenocysteine-containing dehydrogenase